MIQPTLLARPSAPVLAAPPLAVSGDAVFGVSLAALLDVARPPVQPLAAPGKPLPPVLPAAGVGTISPDQIVTVAPVRGAMRTAHSHAIEPAPTPTTEPADVPPVLATHSPPVSTLPLRPLTADAPIAPDDAADTRASATPVVRALRTHRAMHASASPDTIAAVLAEASASAPVDAAPVRLPATKVERHATQPRSKPAQAPVPSRRVPDPIAGPQPRAEGESSEPENPAATATAVFADTPSPVLVDPRQVVLTDAGPAEPQPAQRDVVAAFATPVPLKTQTPVSPIESSALAAPVPQVLSPLIRPAAVEQGTESAELSPQPEHQPNDAPALVAPIMRDRTLPTDVAPNQPDGERAELFASQPIQLPPPLIPPSERPIAEAIFPPIPAATVVQAGQPGTVPQPASPAILAPRITATRRVDDTQPTASPPAGLAPETPVPGATPPPPPPPPIDGVPVVALQPRWPTVQPATGVPPTVAQSVSINLPPPAETAPLDAPQSALPLAAPATPSGTATPSPATTPARVTDAPIEQPDPAIPEPQTPIDRPSPTRPAPAPTSVTVAPPPAITPGATAPAFRLFAQALHAARRDEEVPLAAPTATLEQPRATLAVHAADGAPLDMGDRRWPQAMVDRIEGLRDAVGAAADFASTSIRLTPAALGAIDVSVRTEGDTVHVHFAAEQAATRALLNDAQPRLAELAEARGVKLGQASVGAEADGQGQRQPAPQPMPLAAAPPSARRDDEPDTTTRIA